MFTNESIKFRKKNLSKNTKSFVISANFMHGDADKDEVVNFVIHHGGVDSENDLVEFVEFLKSWIQIDGEEPIPKNIQEKFFNGSYLFNFPSDVFSDCQWNAVLTDFSVSYFDENGIEYSIAVS